MDGHAKTGRGKHSRPVFACCRREPLSVLPIRPIRIRADFRRPVRSVGRGAGRCSRLGAGRCTRCRSGRRSRRGPRCRPGHGTRRRTRPEARIRLRSLVSPRRGRDTRRSAWRSTWRGAGRSALRGASRSAFLRGMQIKVEPLDFLAKPFQILVYLRFVDGPLDDQESQEHAKRDHPDVQDDKKEDRNDRKPDLFFHNKHPLSILSIERLYPFTRKRQIPSFSEISIAMIRGGSPKSICMLPIPSHDRKQLDFSFFVHKAGTNPSESCNARKKIEAAFLIGQANPAGSCPSTIRVTAAMSRGKKQLPCLMPSSRRAGT